MQASADAAVNVQVNVNVQGDSGADPAIASEKEPASASPTPAPAEEEESGFSPLLAIVLVAVIAVVIFTVFPKDEGGSGDLEALLAEGSAVAQSRERGGPQKAVGIFERAVQLAPEDPRANASLGRALTELNRFEQAVPYLRRAREKAQKTHDIDLYLGMALTGMEDYKAAREALENAIRSDPSDPKPLYFLGVGAMRLGEHGATVRYLEPYVRDVPRNLVAWRIYADALSNLGREEDSIAALTSLTRITPEDVPTRRTLQERRLRLHGFDAVLAEERSASEVEGAPPQDVYLHAHLLALHPDRAQEAHAAFEDLKARFPGLIRAELDLATLDTRAGDLEGARGRLQTILSQQSGNLEAAGMLADIELQAGNHAEARKLYTALLNGPLAPHAHMQIVASHLDQGDGEKALEFAKGVLGPAPPGDPRHWALNGEILQAIGRFEEADAVLDGLTKNGRDQDVIIWQGYTAFLALERGAAEEADAAFSALVDTAGVKLPPDTCLWAGVAAHESGDMLKAKTLWGQGAAGPPYGPSGVHTRACQRLRGKADRAQIEAAARIASYRQLGDALFAEGLALEIEGNLAGAKRVYEEARAACRQQEFPARIIDRALARVTK